jgi:Transglutaminase-like superfamily
MRRKLARWRALSRPDRSLLVRSWAYLLVARLGLRCLPLARLQAWMVRIPATPRKETTATPERLASLLGVAARHQPYRTRCLERALALQALLAHAGLRADLRIGIRRTPAGIEAHAWVEHDGVLGEPAEIEHRYLPLEAWTASPRWRSSGLAR